MTTSPTHLSGHVHGEETVEIVARCIAAETDGDDSTWRLWHVQASEIVAALTAADLLATEQEWGVQYDGSEWTDCDSEEHARKIAKDFRGVVVSRGVTPWREQA